MREKDLIHFGKLRSKYVFVLIGIRIKTLCRSKVLRKNVRAIVPGAYETKVTSYFNC